MYLTFLNSSIIIQAIYLLLIDGEDKFQNHIHVYKFLSFGILQHTPLFISRTHLQIERLHDIKYWISILVKTHLSDICQT